MKKNFKILAFVLILGNTIACSQNKSDQELISSLTFTVSGESFEMIFVEGEMFIMGCTGEQRDDCEDNERPAHEATLSVFYMSKYEVTQKLWKVVMWSDINRSYNFGCKDCPIEQVSWNDAQKFISKLSTLTDRNFRLPTEAEWEYAARGGKRSKEYKYNGDNNIDEIAWYIENYQKSKYGKQRTTHPVGMKKNNELSLHDVSGNVWE
ncbi:MAG: formylglycine-generating enzyme family protein [Tannerellaceae bacterium]|jgi:formylglycine-generating enzyme required for sulfatase activity|nr:formylglycine-generating enzyme family protein [Tannerellaceae bacterium]